MGKRKTGSILKRGKVWWIYYTINGKRHSKATSARTKTEAQQILNRHLPREIDFDKRGNILVKEFSTEWLEKRKVYLKPSVYDSYVPIVNKHIIPHFGTRKLNAIYAGDIELFVLDLSKKKGKGEKPISPKTINNIVILLHRIFDDAVDDRRIEINPVLLKKHKLRYDAPEKDHFSIDEINLFLENVNPGYIPFFITAWHTGLRLGELVGLKWADIDWNKKALIVQRSIYQPGKEDVITSPKSKAGKRTIFMTPQLWDTLQKYKTEKKVQSINDYIFEKDGDPYNKDGIVRSQFKQALRKSGLRKTLTPHSMRHGLNTILRKNFPDWIVKRIMGHSHGNGDISDIYSHLTDQELKDYAVKLGELLSRKNNRVTEDLEVVK